MTEKVTLAGELQTKAGVIFFSADLSVHGAP